MKQKSALIVVDMQWGIFNKSTKVYESECLINNINDAINHCRDLGIPIIFLRFTGEFLLVKNSKEWELLPEINFQEGDYIIDKVKSDAFSEPNFVDLLDKLNVKHIYVTGVISHGCVQSTIYGAIKNGCEATLISDAHSNFSKDPAFIIESVNLRAYKEDIGLISTKDFLLLKEEIA